VTGAVRANSMQNLLMEIVKVYSEFISMGIYTEVAEMSGGIIDDEGMNEDTY
jgi:hypothetical protein